MQKKKLPTFAYMTCVCAIKDKKISHPYRPDSPNRLRSATFVVACAVNQPSAICNVQWLSPSAMFSDDKLRGQETPDPERAPCRGPSRGFCCDSLSGRCARDHHSLGAPCEGGGDGHHVHPTSFGHLLAACHLSVACHPSAAHRVGLNQAHSSECMYPHPCLLYQRFRLLAPSMGGDRDLGPGLGLYIHEDGLISIRRLRLPRSEKTEGNPAAVTCCRDGHVTSRASDHWDVVDSWGHRIRGYDEAHRFDEIGSCRRNYLRCHMACCLHLQARHPRRTLLVLEVDLVLARPSNDDLIHVTLQMLVGRLDLQGEGSR